MLNDISERLLYSASAAEQFDAVKELNVLFTSITGIGVSTSGEALLSQTQLPSGLAICPEGAVRCVLDFARTIRFMRGVLAAVEAARRRFPGEVINILYAGCGPHAPLILPLTTNLTPEDIRVTLVDIHERSLEATRILFEALGLSDFVEARVCADATLYRHPQSAPLHVVICETMQKALAKEPQVAVTRNLAPQLCPGGIFVPEKIVLNACVLNVKSEFSFETTGSDGESNIIGGQRKRRYLGQILELTVESAREFDRASNGKQASEFPPAATIEYPLDVPNGSELYVMTEVTVFDTIALVDYESGITYPTRLFDPNTERGGANIQFHYQLGSDPGLRYCIL